MTKQEKIKEEWDLLCPNSQIKICNNTGFSIVYCINGIDDLIDNSIIKESDIDYEFLDSDLIKFRPKPLQGIENNNGWVKIKSVDDLPTHGGDFWIINSYGSLIEASFLVNRKVFFKFGDIKATHYQPIIKPNLPIY